MSTAISNLGITKMKGFFCFKAILKNLHLQHFWGRSDRAPLWSIDLTRAFILKLTINIYPKKRWLRQESGSSGPCAEAVQEAVALPVLLPLVQILYRCYIVQKQS